MQPIKHIFQRYLIPLFLLGLAVGVLGIVTYWAGNIGITPAGSEVLTPFDIPTSAAISATPVLRFARVNPAILDVLDYSASNYGDQNLTVWQTDIQPVGAYLPLTGNTIFELIPATAFPTPLPYPTTPPLPLPPLPELALPTVSALNADGTARVLPFGGSSCAPTGNPVDGVLTQRFHAYHSGIDIGVPLGTPVLATHSGTIVYADWSDIGYGYLVVIQNEEFITYYAHNMSFNVTVGQAVGKGSIIAWSGSTGNSSGPHVHYETRINDVPVDPLTFDARGYTTC